MDCSVTCKCNFTVGCRKERLRKGVSFTFLQIVTLNIFKVGKDSFVVMLIIRFNKRIIKWCKTTKFTEYSSSNPVL